MIIIVDIVYYFIAPVRNSVFDLRAILITSTAIALQWSPPPLVPNQYNINRLCKRVCEPQSAFINTANTATTTSHLSVSIAPYSNCFFQLSAFYGDDSVSLYCGLSTINTLSSGKLLTVLY